jgi:heme exporter protein C
MNLKNNWWKIVAVVLVIYTITAGFLGEVPHLPILHETIRNLYFHVTMWFGMMIILLVSLVYSIKYLSSQNQVHDIIASEAANAGILLGCLGIITGMLWAKFTWGAYWVNDPKLNGAAVTLLIYFAYLILRGSLEEEQKRAKVSAVYNVFAYVMLIVFLMIWPRMNGVDSLPPGNGGNPAFSNYDLDSNMRLVFYPAIIGWTLMGIWMMTLRVRIRKIQYQLLNN